MRKIGIRATIFAIGMLAAAGAAAEESVSWVDRDGTRLAGEFQSYDFDAGEMVFETASGRQERFPAKNLSLPSKFKLVFGDPEFLKSWRAWISPKLAAGELPLARKRWTHLFIFAGLTISLTLISRFYGGWHLVSTWSNQAEFGRWATTFGLGGLGWIIGGCGGGLLPLEFWPKVAAILGIVAVVHALLVGVMHRPKFLGTLVFPFAVHAASALSVAVCLLVPLLFGTWRVSGGLSIEGIDLYLTAQWFELLEMM